MHISVVFCLPTKVRILRSFAWWDSVCARTVSQEIETHRPENGFISAKVQQNSNGSRSLGTCIRMCMCVCCGCAENVLITLYTLVRNDSILFFPQLNTIVGRSALISSMHR